MNGAPESSRVWLARCRKVAMLCALVPLGATRAENQDMARTMGLWNQEQRDRWAAAAGVGSPSPTTWGLVVQVVGERPLPIDVRGDAEAQRTAGGRVLLSVLRGGIAAGGEA